MSARNEIHDGHMSAVTLRRFADKCSTDSNGCWIWQGTLTAEGYGVMQVNQKRVSAHRISYEHHVAPIPAGLVIDHLCRVRACVNPHHLEPVSNRVNVARGVGVTAQMTNKTHCLRGHEFTKENTYSWSGGRRVCKTCHRAKVAARPRRSMSDQLKTDRASRMACPKCGKQIRRDSLWRHTKLVHLQAVTS